MRFSLVGIDHQKAPVALRERVAISTAKLEEALASLRSYVPHGIILSTCNRTEIYSAGNGGLDPQKASIEFLRSRFNVAEEEFMGVLYTLEDRQAAEHLFRVASGLESMVVGEFEILGQLKQALDAAEKAGMVSLPLRHAFYFALRTGRRVREETAISKNALSVSSVAVDLASRITGDLKKCRMLVIGAGEAGRLVAKVAADMGTPDIVIASRTKDRAEELAGSFNARSIDLDELTDELATANVVVACAGAPHRLLNAESVETIMKGRPDQPLLIVDIALPRNVEPDVRGIPNVFLYDLDDLSGISNANRKQREGEMGIAERMVQTEVNQLVSWWLESDIRPIVGALMSRAEEIRAGQLNKTIGRLPPLSDEQRENLESMTKSIVTRILKEPIQYLKANGNTYGAEMIKEVFQLDAEKGGVKNKVVVGTRGSRLALVQTETVVKRLRDLNPAVDITTIEVVTAGDRDHRSPLGQLGVNVFVKELEEALLERRIDLAVHSLKDLPTELPSGLALLAVAERADPRDVLVAGKRLEELPAGATIGTDSMRRALQLGASRPDLIVRSIRGNVDTRLRKFRSGEYDGVILAAAGLKRLGSGDCITQYLPLEYFLPAVGQGALAIEGRSDDTDAVEIAATVNHLPTWQSVVAERAFLLKLGGGCRAPIAALGGVDQSSLRLEGMVAGVKSKKVLRSSVEGSASRSRELGEQLANRLLEMGAAGLIAEAVN